MGLEVYTYKSKYIGKEDIAKDLFNTFYAIKVKQDGEAFKVKKANGNTDVFRYDNLKEFSKDWFLIELIK